MVATMTPTEEAVTAVRQEFAIAAIGGPTAVLDYGGLRFVTDPTLDPPGDYGAYQKLEGPAVAAPALGDIEAVLLSHDLHADNLDRAGREFALRAPVILTGPKAAARIGPPAIGLAEFAEHQLPGTRSLVRVTAVPAQHGPLDGELDEAGNVNTEVSGFVLESDGLPTVYLSGDNAGIAPVVRIAARFPRIEVAVLHCGAARVPAKNSGRALTLSAARAVDVTALLDAAQVIPVHHRGWSIYSEGFDDLDREFTDAGLRSRLIPAPVGRWAIRREIA